jgi:putative RecB family exonuclease
VTQQARPGSQGTLDIGPVTRLYPCTPTRLNTWLDCPRRYRFSYLDRPSPPRGGPRAHTSVGAVVHVALAAWWSRPVSERTPAHAVLDLTRRWDPAAWAREGFRDPAQSAATREDAAEWVRGYTHQLDPGREPVGVERTVSTPTATLVLSGRVDRIDQQDDGRLRIVDYKTGRRAPEESDARTSLPLAIYALAAQRTLRRPVASVELHHLPSGSVVAAEPTPQSLERKLAEAESIAMDARAADVAFREGRGGDDVFPARTSALCSWCDFRGSCPAGQAAAPQIEPWAGLP